MSTCQKWLIFHVFFCHRAVDILDPMDSYGAWKGSLYTIAKRKCVYSNRSLVTKRWRIGFQHVWNLQWNEEPFKIQLWSCYTDQTGPWYPLMVIQWYWLLMEKSCTTCHVPNCFVTPVKAVLGYPKYWVLKVVLMIRLKQEIPFKVNSTF